MPRKEPRKAKRKNRVSAAVADVRAYLNGDTSRVRLERYYVVRADDLLQAVEWIEEDANCLSESHRSPRTGRIDEPHVRREVVAKRSFADKWRLEFARQEKLAP